ncbi:hypothetical protein LINPERHAP1_LOCUS35145 [Linum perenne]
MVTVDICCPIRNEWQAGMHMIYVIAKMRSHLTICCRAESPASMDDLKTVCRLFQLLHFQAKRLPRLRKMTLKWILFLVLQDLHWLKSDSLFLLLLPPRVTRCFQLYDPSLQIDGKTVPTVAFKDQAYPGFQTTVLVVSAKNSCEVPLQLKSVSIDMDDEHGGGQRGAATIIGETGMASLRGDPFAYIINIKNQSKLLQEVKFSLADAQNFVLSGSHNDTVFILPSLEHIVSYKIVPLCSGMQQLPRVNVTSVRYSDAFQPSVAASTVFVFPSKPHFQMSGNKVLEAVSNSVILKVMFIIRGQGANGSYT